MKGWLVSAVCMLFAVVAGCGVRPEVSAQFSGPSEPAARTDGNRQIVFYIDGAGGGGPITDGTPDVRRGFAQAGFAGDFRPFTWHTGLGALADEIASVSFKRRAADRLATEIGQLLDESPDARISIVASSAGTVIAIFALEALESDQQVDAVALLSSAVSAEYDLSEALEHVKARMIVFRNERDSLLRSMMPLVGTADRQSVGDRVAGIYGFVLPEHAEPERLSAYQKVSTIEWTDEFREFDHYGGHTDCKNPLFISRVVVPSLLPGPSPTLAAR